MRIAPFSFKEFDASVVVSQPGSGRHGIKPLLPGGRSKEEVPPPPPPPPSYSEEELAAAKQEAYKQGFEAGVGEGRAQAESEQAAVDRVLTERTAQFTSAVAPLLADYKQFVLQMRQDMPRVAQVIAQKVAGPALDQNAQTVIENVALTCCQTMLSEPKLLITVHAQLAATLEKKLKDLAAQMQAATDIMVAGNEQMPQSDCRIEWKNGQLERSTEQLWAQVERVIADMVASATHTTDVHMEKLQDIIENRHPERSEGSPARDFSASPQNDTKQKE
jgi:flagellar assembly protein FliH